MADHTTAEPSPQSPETVRHQLKQILASHPFATAVRSRRFLTYIVEETLAGQTEGIKELVLGVEVFDRRSDFDPKVDTIVRVEAGKLRKRLQEYYENEGATAPVRIEVPKGSYVPQFHFRDELPAPELPHSARRRGRYAAALLAPLLIAACVWWGARQFSLPKPPPQPSIAILPFLNFSPDPSNEYFADGLAEELTDALCRAGGMRVASRTSAFFFKGKQADAHDIGTKLRVGFIVEGSVRKQGEQLKVTAQLVRTDDGYHVWSGSFERKLRDVFAVQQEIAASVVSTLQVKLTGAQDRRLKKTHTASPQAFDLYLRGRHALTTPAPVDIELAERLFQQSISADPAYALPYVALADLYMNANIFSIRPARELASKAKQAVNTALALDDELAEAHAILGSLAARHEYDWPTAERHLRHALELNPNSAFAHNQLAQNVLAPQGRWQEALAESHRAIELDPFSQEIVGGEPWLAYLERRNEAAVEGSRKLVAAGNLATLVGLGAAQMAKGDFQAALDAFQQTQRLGPSSLTLAMIGNIDGRSGHAAEARQILRELQAESKRRFISPVCFAVIYIGLGEHEGAFQYLEMAREQQESFLIFARVDSLFDPIRSDPRFHTLLAELRLTDEEIQKNQSVASGVHR